MKAVSDVKLSKVVQKIKTLLDGKAASNHNHNATYAPLGKALTREKCTAKSNGSFKSLTSNPLFFIVTIKRTHNSGGFTHISVPIEWNICGKGEQVYVNYPGGQVHFEKETNGICAFEVNCTESGYTHSIERVDGYL